MADMKQDKKSNKDVVHSALMSQRKQEIYAATGVVPPDEAVIAYMGMSEEARKQFLTALKVAKAAAFNHMAVPDNQRDGNKYDELHGLAEIFRKESERTNSIQKQIDYCSRSLEEFVPALNNSKVSIDNIKNELVTLKDSVSGMQDEVKRQIVNTNNEVSQVLHQATNKANKQINDFLSRHESTCNSLEGELKRLLTMATIGSLSNRFERKRKVLLISYIVSFVVFVAALLSFVFVGIWAVRASGVFVTPEMAKEHGEMAKFLVMHKILLRFLPFYLPMLWFACHMNRLVNHNRRLMEEYAHKVVVTQTYVGVAEQVEELAKKGVVKSENLSEELLSSTIRVVCSNPNTALDKVKSTTPISEIVDNVAKLVRTTSEARQVSDINKVN